MGVYRARDVVSVPGLLSLLRLPLAALFVMVLERPIAALAVLCAAGASDVLDGWYARRYGQVTATGAALDPVTDKLFVLTVAVSLVVRGFISPIEVVLLSTRELGELPLVAYVAFSHRARQRRSEYPSANLPGKLATTLQFATASVAIFRLHAVREMVVATALVGIVAAAFYWVREVRAYAPGGGARGAS